MIDFREVIIIDNSQSYENLIEENKVYKKKNYFLGLVVATMIVVIVLNNIENKESSKWRKNKSLKFLSQQYQFRSQQNQYTEVKRVKPIKKSYICK